ncbi:prepilin-type N-terminal cleavage/methylation domain-containing protein [candidate division WOR-3 bacterium]|uniref:Prepilin-type N-terminal cleavage/methylation domain-containing protein n=1 Tax=candidate division WOR-3 bacterium TaxID=2052148 RepID=A0A937XFK8_UNCW3|nr:prepilin-type N-terminal cleavage/methylation domain-containing protein [candidate division WOR-3 bacterium]
MSRFSSLTPLRRVPIIHAVSSTSRGARGFTLVELLVVISVLGIILAFFVPTIAGRIATNARRVATLQEMRMLRDAIAGDPDIRMSGEMVVTGFKNDIGRWPRDLVELATSRPDTGFYAGRPYPGKTTLPAWDPYLKKGWNGPYVREDGNMGYTEDAWITDYMFEVRGTDTVGLRSAGPDQMFWKITPGAQDSDDIWVFF